MRTATLALFLVVAAGCGGNPSVRPPSAAPKPAAADLVRADGTLMAVLERAQTLVAHGGLNAGGTYPETWVRDLATYLPLYLDTGGDAGQVRQALLTLLAFQGADGNIPDGFAPIATGRPGSFTSPLAPGFLAFKNDVESDQESSLVQAFADYVRATGDTGILAAQVGGRSALERLDAAMRFLLAARRDPVTGLIWSGATIDWGDVRAGPGDATRLEQPPHRAIGIYANAMLSLALRDLLTLPGADVAYWTAQRATLDRDIRTSLWDAKAGKYRAHLYLDGSPWAAGFDEAAVTVHGGTAVAILAGLLSPAEVRHSLSLMDADVLSAHANSLGLTVWPPYPAVSFAVPMRPDAYQNAGDWDWFGARWVQALVATGDIADAYRELRPMAARVVDAGDFYEWWDWSGRPHGSPHFRGAAGEMGLAVLELERSVGADVLELGVRYG